MNMRLQEENISPNISVSSLLSHSNLKKIKTILRGIEDDEPGWVCMSDSSYNCSISVYLWRLSFLHIIILSTKFKF